MALLKPRPLTPLLQLPPLPPPSSPSYLQDWFDDPVHNKESGENRAATVLLYLGEVLEGGETSLPLARPIDEVKQKMVNPSEWYCCLGGEGGRGVWGVWVAGWGVCCGVEALPGNM